MSKFDIDAFLAGNTEDVNTDNVFNIDAFLDEYSQPMPMEVTSDIMPTFAETYKANHPYLSN